jgi:hypothetical protein
MIVRNEKSRLSKKAAFVVPLGLEPRLFCTKNRRVASYTMGQFWMRIYFLFFILPNFFPLY